MINKTKNRKAWYWKVATFLPLLALLLMAFGKKGEVLNNLSDLPAIEVASSAVVSSEPVQDQYEQFKRKIERLT